MNLKGLRLFRAVVTSGSLSDGAERLNLSPSAASRLLSQLEEGLELTLFSRSRRNLELTEDGALFYQHISNTLDGIDEIPRVARDLRSRSRDWLSVVTAAPLANSLVVPTIARVRAAGIDLHCTLQVESRFEIERKVAARGYNIGFISLPVENEIIEVDLMPLLRARMCVLMPQDHPLAQEDEVGLKQLAATRLVTLASGQRWRSRLEKVFGDAGLRPEIAFETGSTLVTIEMVRHGLGLSLIDPVAVTEVGLSGLAMRPLAGDHWGTYASIHARGPHPELSEVFLDAMSDLVEERRSSRAELAEALYLI